MAALLLGAHHVGEGADLEGIIIALVGNPFHDGAGGPGPDMGIDADRRVDGRQGDIGPDQRNAFPDQPLGNA